MEKLTKNIPDLHLKFFWDFRFDSIDWHGEYKMVIARIVERGGQDQINKIVRFYGRQKVIKAIREEIYFLPTMQLKMPLNSFPNSKKGRNVLLTKSQR